MATSLRLERRILALSPGEGSLGGEPRRDHLGTFAGARRRPYVHSNVAALRMVLAGCR